MGDVGNKKRAQRDTSTDAGDGDVFVVEDGLWLAGEEEGERADHGNGGDQWPKPKEVLLPPIWA